MNLYILFLTTNALFISSLFCMLLGIDKKLIFMVNGSIQIILILVYFLQEIIVKKILTIIIKTRLKRNKELDDFEVEGK